jgi:uncharacterized protein (DUF697 family)
MKNLTLETIDDVDYLAVDDEITAIFFDETEAAELRTKHPSLWLAHLLKTLEGERLELLKNVRTHPKKGAIRKAKNAIQEQFEKAKKEFDEFGGWKGFKSGQWFIALVRASFRAYYEKAHYEYFKAKYPGADDDGLIEKLTSVAARNAAILGGIVGAAVGADEIAALAELGITLPANLAIAGAAVAGELILLTRIQLQLIANIAKIMRVHLDPDDPEDILLIFAFAVGGSVSEAAGKEGMKIGGHLTKVAVKKTINKEVLKKLREIALKLGYKLLQRTIIKYAVPLASIGIGAVWNYVSTQTVAKIAKKHFKERKKRNGNCDDQ